MYIIYSCVWLCVDCCVCVCVCVCVYVHACVCVWPGMGKGHTGKPKSDDCPTCHTVPGLPQPSHRHRVLSCNQQPWPPRLWRPAVCPKNWAKLHALRNVTQHRWWWLRVVHQAGSIRDKKNWHCWHTFIVKVERVGEWSERYWVQCWKCAWFSVLEMCVIFSVGNVRDFQFWKCVWFSVRAAMQFCLLSFKSWRVLSHRTRLLHWHQTERLSLASEWSSLNPTIVLGFRLKCLTSDWGTWCQTEVFDIRLRHFVSDWSVWHQTEAFGVRLKCLTSDWSTWCQTGVWHQTEALGVRLKCLTSDWSSGTGMRLKPLVNEAVNHRLKLLVSLWSSWL